MVYEQQCGLRVQKRRKTYEQVDKKNIFEIIEKSGCELNCSVEKLKKLPTQVLKDICLSYSSWHHTSNHYNKTDFYSVDTDRLRFYRCRGSD